MATDEGNLLELEDNITLQGEESYSKNELHFRQNKSLPDEDKNKIDQLKDVIQKNLIGCDLSICLFTAALRSYRVDGCLRPFPHYFVTETNEKDFASLKTACDKLPNLKDFLTLPTTALSKDVVNLLSWLFLESGFPSLTLHSLKELPISIANENNYNKVIPQYVFKVHFTKKLEENWMNRVKNRDIFYAFHGSSIDNFYSIIKFGLQQHFSRTKEVLFGNGIYLSNELSVCTNFAPFGHTWKNSLLGTKHSIIAVGEVINDHEEVKCKDNQNKRRAINQNSYGEIPEKYFVVRNSELVRVKYLLVYSQKTSHAVKSFIKANLLWISIIFYFLLLVFIGFFNGPYWRKFIRFMSK